MNDEYKKKEHKKEVDLKKNMYIKIVFVSNLRFMNNNNDDDVADHRA